MSQAVKGSVHYVTGGLALALTLYQVLRLAEAPSSRTHLWVNLAVYAPLFCFEGYHTFRHWQRDG